MTLLILFSAQSFQVPPSRTRQIILLRTSNNDNDGWDDNSDTPTNRIDEKNMQLLKSLQEKPVAAKPLERDMFIPVFTLIAIAGFTGAYGYEMLRLYSRGELYLPF